MSAARLQVSRRQRATPYTPRVEALGVSGFAVVNHTILPKGFGRSEQLDYLHLREHVQLWDVGCERQVELAGADAARLAQWLTPRDLRDMQPGQCRYAPLVDEQGGMLNDPVILKLADNRFRLSIADADIGLWAQGLALGRGLDVTVDEPDVWPLAVQGPKSDDLAARVFGDAVRDIGFFRFTWLEYAGHEYLVARSGFSRQGGFEVYVEGFERGAPLWDALWEAGSDLDIAPGYPNLIERIEGGLLSYGNEMTRANNPFECNLDKFCRVDGAIDCIGRDALAEIARSGPARRIRGVIFDGEPSPPCRHPWPLAVAGVAAGAITSAAFSPRFERNVALGMLERDFWEPGTRVSVDCGDGSERRGIVSHLPMEEADAGL